MLAPFSVFLVGVFLFPISAKTESICDPGSGFGLSPEMRARWCPEYSAPARTRAYSANRLALNVVPDSQPKKKKKNKQKRQGRHPESLSTPPPQKAEAPPIEEPKARPASPSAKEKVLSEPSDSAMGLEAVNPDREGGVCSQKELRFSANHHPAVPGKGANIVWGGNATDGETGSSVLSTGYSSSFLNRAEQARKNGIEVFAYLEGPCGFTNGKDKGNETTRCRDLHNAFNSKKAQGTKNSQMERWKPFTLFQMRQSGKYKIGHCEIDNLNNNVNVPFIPLLKEIKEAFDKGEIYCRLVLKNVSARDIENIKSKLAPTIPEAGFISPFQIKEAGGNGPKKGLQAAFEKLKGTGVATIMSIGDWASDNYGHAFSKERFLTCGK